MKAYWNNVVIADAKEKDIIHIEGNKYFPPSAIKQEYFTESEKNTHCHWKGEASYYQIDVNGLFNPDGAWYYPNPLKSSIEEVKKDYTNYVAFWHGVEVK